MLKFWNFPLIVVNVNENELFEPIKLKVEVLNFEVFEMFSKVFENGNKWILLKVFPNEILFLTMYAARRG